MFLRCFVQGSNKAFSLEPGKQQGILAGFCRYSFSWSLQKSWYVPVFFCWLLVKKLISQKTLLRVVICANENWVALLFQDSLVLCSVKRKGWPFETILVWRLGPRARAPCEGVVSTLFGRARGPGAIKPHNEKLADHFQQTQMTKARKKQITGFRSPPTGIGLSNCI